MGEGVAARTTTTTTGTHRLSLVGNLWNDRFCVLRLELVHLLKQQFMCDGMAAVAAASSVADTNNDGGRPMRRRTARRRCEDGRTDTDTDERRARTGNVVARSVSAVDGTRDGPEIE